MCEYLSIITLQLVWFLLLAIVGVLILSKPVPAHLRPPQDPALKQSPVSSVHTPRD